MPLLRVTGPSGTTSEFPLTTDELTLGRERDNGVVLAGNGVSRRHARVLATARGYLLVDADSVNGIWLGDHKVRHHFLSSGDVLRIGENRIEFVEDEDDRAPTVRMDAPPPPPPRAAPPRPAAAAPPAAPRPVVKPSAAPAPTPARPAPVSGVTKGSTLCARCAAPIPPALRECGACGMKLFTRPSGGSRKGLWVGVFLFFFVTSLVVAGAAAYVLFLRRTGAAVVPDAVPGSAALRRG